MMAGPSPAVALSVQSREERQAMATYTFADPRNLSRVIANAVIFSARDNQLPVLTAVHFEWREGKVCVTATDRYRLSMETVDAQLEGDAFAFTLSRADATDLAKALKGADALATTTLELTDDGDRIAVGLWGKMVRSYRTVAGDFPKFDRLFPSGNPTGAPVMGFNPAHLADLGKVKTGGYGRTSSVRLEFHGPTRPAVASFGEDGPTVLLMPVRLAETAKAA